MQIGQITIQHGTTQVRLRTYDQLIKGRLVPLGGEDDEEVSPQKTARFRAIPSVAPLSRPASSYAGEHMRMKPVMDVVRGSGDLLPISAGFEVYRNGSLAAKVNWRWNHKLEKIIGLDVRLLNNANTDQVEARINTIFEAAGFFPIPYHFEPEE